MSGVTAEDMCKEIMANKHSEINIFFMEKQKTIKGFVKNAVINSNGEEKSLYLSLEEMKNDEQILAKHSCKKKDCGSGEKKDRINLEINNIEELDLIEKNALSNMLTYKLDFGDETIGVVVKI